MGLVPQPGNVLKTLAGSTQIPRHIAFEPPSLKSEILKKVFHYHNKKSKKWPTHLLNPCLESAVHTKSYKHINILFVCIHTPSWTDNLMHFKCVCVWCESGIWNNPSFQAFAVSQAQSAGITLRTPVNLLFLAKRLLANQCAGTAISH